jgi:ERCC4-type nuclease
MFNFKIDTREQNKDLFLYFDLYSKEKKFTYEKIFLEVGDVICGNVCIERKEAGDFVSSIMDGRLNEQAIKMCLNYKHKYIIIEGDVFKTKSNISHHAIIGKMASLCVRYGIKIITVDSTQHFVYTCYALVSKHVEQNEFSPIDFEKYIPKLQLEDIPVAMLMQIPGIGKEKATKIIEYYNYSIKDLFNNIKREDLMQIDGIKDKIADKIIDAINYKKIKK